MLLRTESRIRNSRVFSVLLLLTPCGIETLSWTQRVIDKTGLTFISVSRKKMDILKYIFFFQKNDYLKKYIHWTPVMVSCCWYLFTLECTFEKDIKRRASLLPVCPLPSNSPSQWEIVLYIFNVYMYISRAILCMYKKLHILFLKCFIIDNLKHIQILRWKYNEPHHVPWTVF